LVDVEVVVLVAHVHDHGPPAGLQDRLEGGGERACRDDDAVFAVDPRRQQREPKRVEPARDAHAVRPAYEVRKMTLELSDGLAVEEVALVERPRDSLENALLDRLARRAEVDEGDV
jgi:hypothetical protein